MIVPIHSFKLYFNFAHNNKGIELQQKIEVTHFVNVGRKLYKRSLLLLMELLNDLLPLC